MQLTTHSENVDIRSQPRHDIIHKARSELTNTDKKILKIKVSLLIKKA